MGLKMQTIFALLAMMFVASPGQDSIQPYLIGLWGVGSPYDLRQPVGLHARQEAKIRNMKIRLAMDHIEVCGKIVQIESVQAEDLSTREFLLQYGFSPRRIGLDGSRITEVTINEHQSRNACGKFEDPGTNLLISAQKVVMQTGNDYFPLDRL